MNPARLIGPALVSGQLHDLWIYVLVPIAGAALGALAYRLVGGGPEADRPTESGPEADRTISPPAAAGRH